MDWRKVYVLLFFLGLFFLPFTSMEGYKILSVLKKVASAYFWIPALLLLFGQFLLCKKKIAVPVLAKSYKLFFVFLGFCILTLLFNLEGVLQSFYKQKSGLYMFGFNFFMLIFSGIIIVLLVYNVARGMKVESLFFLTRKVLFGSFLFVFFYALIQMLILRFKVFSLEPVFYFLDYLPFVRGYMYYGTVRLNSVTFEVPALGTYLIFVAGWMFSYILTHQSKWRFLPFLMVLFLVYFSGARSALVSIVPQLAIICFFYRPFFVFIKKNVVFMLQVGGILLLTLVAFKGNTIVDKLRASSVEQWVGTSISNKSRIGMQVASLEVFCDSPVYGVGLGQETYSKMKYYPDWAVRDNYEFSAMYLNEEDRMYPPAFNLYTKLLAETGIIGFALFSWFLWTSVKENYTLVVRSLGTHRIFAQTLLITLVGLIVNWGQNDDYLLFGFWISYAFLLVLINNKLKDGEREGFRDNSVL